MRSSVACCFASVGLVALGCASTGDHGAVPPSGGVVIEPTEGVSNDVLVEVELVQDKGKHTYNEASKVSPDAHVVITLRRYVGEDASAPLVTQVDVPFTGFPFVHEVRGDSREVFASGRPLLVAASVLNHAGADAEVGDWISESSNKIDRAGQKLDVTVSGIESCDAPNAGGYCL